MAELSPRYDPKQVEERLYQSWESQGLFHAEPDPSRTPYTIVIPPPNVTGILHMGHALNNTIQDILIRFKRMQGFNALWVPGTDHAGIATQNVVEKQIAKEGKRRQDLGRDAFIQRVWQWKEQYGNTIIYQLKRLGASCDWQRTRFTMDAGLSEAVAEVFVRLYEKGLIYRGQYIINWCPRCQTALADEEAPHKDSKGHLWYVRYPLQRATSDRAGGPAHFARGGEEVPHAVERAADERRATDPEFITIATTRPETMLGDTAIAVHPKDKRYKKLIGRKAILPLVGRELPIIADELVDPEFGTGAVKVTPAHDPVDFQLSKRHNLPVLDIMTDDAHMVNVPQPYQGLDRFECRKRVVEALESQHLIEKIDDHQHGVGHCYRCDTVVEPRLSLQWFVRMKPLAEPAIKAVKSKKLTFTPPRWTKVYLNWMENIQDWCISRQIWWGHRIPVWYCNACISREASAKNPDRKPENVIGTQPTDVVRRDQPGVIVSKTPPERCPNCGSIQLAQDADVLDTWFSSWLWPFSTLGWPKSTPELDYFYPTNTLVTAPEIIFFWVARMIMAGFFCMGEQPFSKIYIHGTVRDLTGKKMSKSLGNIIDPIEIIDKFGTDALRYTLITSTAIGQDVFISEERFTIGRNFANKLWNVTRYLLSQPGVDKAAAKLDAKSLTVLDRWILSRLHRTIGAVTKALERFAFNEATQTLYDFVWHDYCDWYVELSKTQLASQDDAGRARTLAILAQVLETSLRLLHPVIPFVTEELWQHLRPVQLPASSSQPPTSIMTAPWPKAASRWINADVEAQVALLQAVVTAIRNTKAELNVPVDTRPAVQLVTKQPEVRAFFEAHRRFLQALAQIGHVTIGETGQRSRDAAAAVVDGVEVLVPLAGLIDVERERQRIQTRIDELTAELGRIEAKLADRQFVERAPEAVVEQVRTRRQQVQDTLAKFTGYLQVLQAL